MMNIFSSNDNPYENAMENMMFPAEAIMNQVNTAQNCCTGFAKYLNDFMTPYMLSVNYFTGVEQSKMLGASPLESLEAYMGLTEFNIDLTNRFMLGSMKAISDFGSREMGNAFSACINTLFDSEGEDIGGFMDRQAETANQIANAYPEAIRDIEPEFGFHFESGKNIKVAETDRFILYQIVPTDGEVQVMKDGKPILILPPYVLGANILAFLPNDDRSYTHCFANQGIPTYIRIMKDISITPELQTMSGEDDALDTRFFCEKIMERHGKPVTLNGYCQGGFMAVCDILSGELDGLVDALLTCVSPMDGTRSVGLTDFLHGLPSRFRELAYGTKLLPNGNRVGDGKLMGWVYKLKSIENESPFVAFLRDAAMLKPRNGKKSKISKTAAALNYWLENERNDLPLAITEMSFESYSTPITSDGTLPVKLFGRKLNFKRMQEKGIKWLICYGERDDLVEKETALAPLDYIDAEVSAFPKGHVAIATSWSNPKSACALHMAFGEKNYRGPVRFQLDLDKELSESS